MPRHDPVPPRRTRTRSDSALSESTAAGPEIGDTSALRDPRDLERSHRAWLRYMRLMKWMSLAAFGAVVAALLYLKLSGSPMPINMVIATILGVGLSVLLGTALMGLVFLSDSGGHDDAAAGWRPES